MPDHLAQVLRDGSDVVAEAIRPRQAVSIRARGDRRRRQLVVGSAVATVAVVAAGGGAVAYVSTVGGTRTPAGSTTHHHAPVEARVEAVPNVVGLTERAAVSMLTAAGFSVTVEVLPCSTPGSPPGTVCMTMPAAGVQILTQQAVTIMVVPARRALGG